MYVHRRVSMHQSKEQSFFFISIKHMVKGSNLAELRAQIHVSAIDTV